MKRYESIRRGAQSWVTALLLGIVASLLIAPHLPGIQTAGIIPPARAGESDPAPGEVILTFGVGGVLTADGILWQYRPDLDKWMTMDEAFLEEGRETSKVLPLPVPADKIQDMATWGFILTTSGDLWLYEMASDKWRRLKPPGSGR